MDNILTELGKNLFYTAITLTFIGIIILVPVLISKLT